MAGVGDGSQVDEVGAVAKDGGTLSEDAAGNGTLADPTRSDKRHEPAARNQKPQLFDLRIAPDEPGERRGEPAPGDPDSGHGRRGIGSYFGDERISTAERVHDIPPAVALISQRAPEGRDVNSKIHFLDDSPGPGARDQFLFGDQLAGPLEHHQQEIECTIAEGNGPSCIAQHALDGPQFERSEAKGASCAGYGNSVVVSRCSTQTISLGLGTLTVASFES